MTALTLFIYWAVYVYITVVALSSAYCLFLFLVALASSFCTSISHTYDKKTNRDPSRWNSFLILIPAHNEELVLDAVLTSVSNQAYPADRVKVIVIADNCSDRTSEIAASYSDVTLWERFDSDESGKPSALNWALERLNDDHSFDALVVIDADTFVDFNFLDAMNRAIIKSDSDLYAAQGYYGVLNIDESWRTALMAGALGLAHYVRPLARETLGLSAGLKGNGMCFSNRLSKMVKWRPGALTEDIELGFDLVELYRIRVRFVKDAIVRAQMPTSGKQSESQRLRWEKGRSFIRRHRAWPLFLKGLVRLDFTAVDCALDVIVPPLAELALLIMFGAALIGIVKFIGAPIFGLSAELVFCAFGFILYVLGGMMLSDVPREAFYALFIGPFYAFWKLFMILFRSKGRPKTWKKTKRKAIELQQSSKNAAKNDLDKL